MSEWGSSIDTGRKRPEWLLPIEPLMFTNYFGNWSESNSRNYSWAWENISAIRLPADHGYYTAVEHGFTYWPGGPDAPIDWDNGAVLSRTGATFQFPRDWNHIPSPGRSSRGADIIGYRKRVAIDPDRDRDAHRAAVEAGYAPLDEYVAVETGGCAPPVLVTRAASHLPLPGEQQLALFAAGLGPQPEVAGPYSIGSDVWPGLSKLIEEAGEVIQVGGKLMQRAGSTDHWSGDLRQMAVDEIGDLYAALDFFVDKNPTLSRWEIAKRRFEKQVLFQAWHKENAA